MLLRQSCTQYLWHSFIAVRLILAVPQIQQFYRSVARKDEEGVLWHVL